MYLISSSDIPGFIESGLAALRSQQNEINKLNVFPVPDGDTGTNLVLTMQAMSEELAKNSKQSMSSALKALAFGSLMGARGNAGVIMSQIVRGMCEALESSETLAVSEITRALENGVKVAYQAVRKPVEGTMLTVLKDATVASQKLEGQDLDLSDMLDKVLREAKLSLERTPDLLPVLKEAGVVDAGGYGLVVIGEGILAAIKGEKFERAQVDYRVSVSSEEEIYLKFKYCTELLLKGNEIKAEDLEKNLEQLGDSVMVVGSSGITRVHVHSNHPGQILEIALSAGSISQVRVNNMEEQAEERSRKLAAASVKDIEIVAIGSGSGVRKILTSLGVEKIIDGGQGMNPSTAEILEAIEDSSADKVLVLPNNKNIVMAAQTAAKESKKEASVVATKSIMEAFSALLAYDPEATMENNVQMMKEAIAGVKTGEVTQAIRDSKSKAGKIKKDDFLGLCDHEIRVVGKSLREVAQKLIEAMLGEDDEVITLISGADLSMGESEEIRKEILKNHSDLEVELHAGGQPLYNLLIGIE